MKRFLAYLHPFFFTLFPILELRNHNITYVDAASLVRPALLSILLTVLIWTGLRMLSREWRKSGILTSLIVTAFFTYGHVFLEIESLFGTPIRHRYLALIYAVLLLVCGTLIYWKVKRPDALIIFLAVMGGVLIVSSITRSLQHDLAVYQSGRLSLQVQSPVLQNAGDTDTVLKPDIYLILLDAHTSARTLKEEFHFDDTAFVQQLKDLGFYVAECSQSNYPVTNLSVTSLFYARYHQEPTLYPIYSSLVIDTLRSEGYHVITFENRSNGHFDIGEDMRLSRNQMLLGRVDLTGGLSEFEIMLWKTSFLRIAYDMPQLIPGFNVQSVQKVEYYEHIQETYFMLDELKHLPGLGGPKFVFAHFLVPHPPFIFTPDGKFYWAPDPATGYVTNVKFIDTHIVPVVAEIIKKSKTPPVIIIMGDHGATGVPRLETPQRRMSILNAYYVNEQAKQDLYETITPINSFRVIFNNYFGKSYPLLEDLSYHSANMNRFTPETLVANPCQATP